VWRWWAEGRNSLLLEEVTTVWVARVDTGIVWVAIGSVAVAGDDWRGIVAGVTVVTVRVGWGHNGDTHGDGDEAEEEESDDLRKLR